MTSDALRDLLADEWLLSPYNVSTLEQKPAYDPERCSREDYLFHIRQYKPFALRDAHHHADFAIAMFGQFGHRMIDDKTLANLREAISNPTIHVTGKVGQVFGVDQVWVDDVPLALERLESETNDALKADERDV